MSVIAEAEGTHPLFAGVGEPADFASAETPWSVRKQGAANFIEWNPGGRGLSYRLPAAPTVVANMAEVSLPTGETAVWEAFETHLKFSVVFAQKPVWTKFTLPTSRTGLDFTPDGDGGFDITADGVIKVGAVPRPWMDDAEGNRHLLSWVAVPQGIQLELPVLENDNLWNGAVLDPTTIDTSTVSTATAYSNQRKIDRCQNGVLWTCFWNGTSTTTASMEFWYSTDNGATFNEGTHFGFTATSAGYTPNASFFIDLDDFAHVVYKDRSGGFIYYRRGTPNAARTAWTWSGAQSIYAATNADHPDVIAHREGTGWVAHAVFRGFTDMRVMYRAVSITDGGVMTVGALTVIVDNDYTSEPYPSIDWNHDGFGKTVKPSENPDLYVAWSGNGGTGNNGIMFRKAIYSAGSWDWGAGAPRQIDSTVYAPSAWSLNCLFDGTRVIIGGFVYPGSGNGHLRLYERDAADTTTTSYNLLTSAVASETLYSGSMTYDGDGNVYFFGRNADEASGTHDLVYRKWIRNGGSLEAEVVVDSGVGGTPYVSTKRGYSNGLIEFVYTDGMTNPFVITYDSIPLGIEKLRLGGNIPDAIMAGATQVDKVYLGPDLVWG